MLGFVKKRSGEILQQRLEQRIKTFVEAEETTQPPEFHVVLPPEGSLVCIGDIRNMHYLDAKNLIDPETNIYYYNSCICKYQDKYRLFYRCGKNPKTCEDRIATCLLTKELQVIPETNRYIDAFTNLEQSRLHGPLKGKNRDILYFYPKEYKHKKFVFKDNHHAEDPRAIEFNNHWFVFYTDGLTIGVAKLHLDTCDLVYSHYLKPPSGSRYDHSDGREKNWIPAIANNELYILYSEEPRTFFYCKDELTKLTIVKPDILEYFVTWPYGIIRGSCPPISYDNDRLIWFFHSAKHVSFLLSTDNTRKYFIGAYLTSKYYPFEIESITTYPIFFGIPSHISKENNYQTNVVFPCGAVQEGDTFIISMGVNDFCIGHLRIDKKDIIWKPFVKEIDQKKR